MFGKFFALCLLVSAVYSAEPPCPNEGVVKLANPNDPAGFFLCLDGVGLPFNCESGKFFDHSSQICKLFRENVHLPRINPLCPETGWSLIPHDAFCSKFFKCNEGVATVMDCPLGLHYDPITKHCDYPEIAKCTLENQTQAPTTAEPATTPAVMTPTVTTPATDPPTSLLTTFTTVKPTTSDDFWTTTELTTIPIDVTSTPVDLTTLPGAVPPQDLNCDLTCVTETAYVPDQSSCVMYWRCENGTAVSEKCELGLRFNPLSKTCDYAMNVKCT